MAYLTLVAPESEVGMPVGAKSETVLIQLEGHTAFRIQ